jgi:hypothetical protein
MLIVISEMVASSNGIGYFILAAERGFQIKAVFARVAIIGYLMNRILSSLRIACRPHASLKDLTPAEFAHTMKYAGSELDVLNAEN